MIIFLCLNFTSYIFFSHFQWFIDEIYSYILFFVNFFFIMKKNKDKEKIYN